MPNCLPAMSDLLNRDAVAQTVRQLADEITPSLNDDWVIVALMDGALVFAADFLRALYDRGVNPVFETLCLSSYGHSHTSSGRVRCLKDIEQDLSGRSVLILDDVYESGHTISFARQYLKAKGATEIKVCVFCRKPYHNPAGESPEYIGWEAPDRFLIGYGLDDKGRYRGLPSIQAVD